MPIQLSPTVEIFFGSAWKINEDGKYMSGGSAFHSEGNPNNGTFRAAEDGVTKDTGILYAILHTFRTMNTYTPILAHISSNSVVRNLTVSLPKNEDTNWLHHDDAQPYQAIVAPLRQRAAPTLLQSWSTKTPNSGRMTASNTAKEALTHPSIPDVDLSIDKCFMIQGLRLATGSQRSFYKALVCHYTSVKYKPKMKTKINIALVQSAITELRGSTPMENEIWRSIRVRDIPRSIKNDTGMYSVSGNLSIQYDLVGMAVPTYRGHKPNL
ncbi:hypothetical protein EDD15DRAFT_2200042 [Pisolithus albus]|nr:hypothetical protein EDD15DRAFT_2200042 [Pisolithus albus]